MFTLNVFGATLNSVIWYLFNNLYELLPTHGLALTLWLWTLVDSVRAWNSQSSVSISLFPKKIYGVNRPKPGWKPWFTMSPLGAFNTNSRGTLNTSAAFLQVLGRSVTLTVGPVRRVEEPKSFWAHGKSRCELQTLIELEQQNQTKLPLAWLFLPGGLWCPSPRCGLGF